MLEGLIEKIIFASRWLLAPLYLGLALALIPILFRFFDAFWHMMTHISSSTSAEVTLEILELLDTVLLANLIIIILFAGYENFVSKLSIGDHEDRPAWMGKVGFADLKMKLIGAIVAISAVELLKAFLVSTSLTSEQILMKVVIHLTFVISGLLFAASDWISDSRKSL